jgi:deoxyribonuclease V
MILGYKNIIRSTAHIYRTRKDPSNYHWAIEMQESIAKKIIEQDHILEKTGSVCGVDVCYKNNTAYSAGVILNHKLEIIELVSAKTPIKFPYIPGLFMLRESVPILNTIRALTHPFDVLLVDGHGVLHPRRCGLASYVGFILAKPTIGVAKTLHVGTVIDTGFVEYNDNIMGCRIRKEYGKDIFVSVGHYISLVTAISIVRIFTKVNEWIPEPLRLADIHSKNNAKIND